MLSVTDAYTLLKNENIEADKCFEYESIYVFRTIPDTFESLLSVNKESGAIQHFKPFHIPIDEYKAGKEITNFN